MSNILEVANTEPELTGDKLKEYVTLVYRTNKFQQTVSSDYYSNVYKWWITDHCTKYGTSPGTYSISLDELDARLYPTVKDVVFQPGMTALERNKATGFHRSAISVLRKYARYLDSTGMKANDPLAPPSANDVRAMSASTMSEQQQLIQNLTRSLDKAEHLLSGGAVFTPQERKTIEYTTNALSTRIKRIVNND